jgi:pilus assembly protein CpaE
LLEGQSSGQTLRVLLISADELTRDEVERALSVWGRSHRLYWVSQPNLASARAQDVVPHGILVDDALAGANMVPLIRELGARVPGAAILALVAEGAMQEAREAVLAGARSFLIKPLMPDELVATLRQTVGHSYAARPAPEAAPHVLGRIVAFCAPKGGTGRTTLALNTAMALRRETGEAVVLVDADYAAPAVDVALNVHAERSIVDLLPRLSRLDEELIAGVLAKHASGVELLLAPPPEDLSNPITLPQVQHVLSVLKRMFNWVIVDLGLPLDETAFAFLDSADRIVLTVLPEMVGLRNTRMMLDQLLDGRGYVQDKIWLVLNRAGMRGGIGQRQIEKRLRMPPTHRIPDDQPLATHAVNRGVPLASSHPRSAVARAIHKLARNLVEDKSAHDSTES